MPAPGRLERNLQRDALLRLDAQDQQIRRAAVAVVAVEHGAAARQLNWMAISVTRLGRRLPVRM